MCDFEAISLTREVRLRQQCQSIYEAIISPHYVNGDMNSLNECLGIIETISSCPAEITAQTMTECIKIGSCR